VDGLEPAVSAISDRCPSTPTGAAAEAFLITNQLNIVVWRPTMLSSVKAFMRGSEICAQPDSTMVGASGPWNGARMDVRH
tara:strand:- start:334 stop:573 length:240 start_codon:yes stop_codon:yes gene_type:complete